MRRIKIYVMQQPQSVRFQDSTLSERVIGIKLTSMPWGWGICHSKRTRVLAGYDAEQFNWKSSPTVRCWAKVSFTYGFGACEVSAVVKRIFNVSKFCFSFSSLRLIFYPKPEPTSPCVFMRAQVQITTERKISNNNFSFDWVICYFPIMLTISWK